MKDQFDNIIDAYKEKAEGVSGNLSTDKMILTALLKTVIRMQVKIVAKMDGVEESHSELQALNYFRQALESEE